MVEYLHPAFPNLVSLQSKDRCPGSKEHRCRSRRRTQHGPSGIIWRRAASFCRESWGSDLSSVGTMGFVGALYLSSMPADFTGRGQAQDFYSSTPLPIVPTNY